MKRKTIIWTTTASISVAAVAAIVTPIVVITQKSHHKSSEHKGQGQENKMKEQPETKSQPKKKQNGLIDGVAAIIPSLKALKNSSLIEIDKKAFMAIMKDVRGNVGLIQVLVDKQVKDKKIDLKKIFEKISDEDAWNLFHAIVTQGLKGITDSNYQDIKNILDVLAKDKIVKGKDLQLYKTLIDIAQGTIKKDLASYLVNNQTVIDKLIAPKVKGFNINAIIKKLLFEGFGEAKTHSTDPHKIVKPMIDYVIKQIKEAKFITADDLPGLASLAGIDVNKVYEILSGILDNILVQLLPDMNKWHEAETPKKLRKVTEFTKEQKEKYKKFKDKFNIDEVKLIAINNNIRTQDGRNDYSNFVSNDLEMEYFSALSMWDKYSDKLKAHGYKDKKDYFDKLEISYTTDTGSVWDDHHIKENFEEWFEGTKLLVEYNEKIQWLKNHKDSVDFYLRFAQNNINLAWNKSVNNPIDTSNLIPKEMMTNQFFRGKGLLELNKKDLDNILFAIQKLLNDFPEKLDVAIDKVIDKMDFGILVNLAKGTIKSALKKIDQIKQLKELKYLHILDNVNTKKLGNTIYKFAHSNFQTFTLEEIKYLLSFAQKIKPELKLPLKDKDMTLILRIAQRGIGKTNEEINEVRDKIKSLLSKLIKDPKIANEILNIIIRKRED